MSVGTSYVFFASDRFGSIDAIIPLFCKLGLLKGSSLYFVFPERRALLQVRQDPFLNKVINDFDIKCLCVDRCHPSFLQDCFGLAVLLLRFSNRLVFSRSLAGRKTQFVLGLTRLLGGKCFEAPRQKVPIRFKGVPRKTSDIPFLYQDETDLEKLAESGRSKGIRVGHPCFYKSWTEYVKKIAPDILRDEMRFAFADKPLISVFLGSVVSGVFEWREQEQYISDVLGVVDSLFGDRVRVVLKPHPTSDIEVISHLVPNAFRSSVTLCTVNACVLAAESRVVICRHSSTILDVIALDTPVILFQQFTTHWKKYHPDNSCYLQLGIPCAETATQLQYLLSREFDRVVGGSSVNYLLGTTEPATIQL